MITSEELEKIINDKLLERGFSEKILLNNRGLIGATVSEMIQYVYSHIPK
jgi:hypothetical protein